MVYMDAVEAGEGTIDTALMNIAPTEKITELEDGLSAVRYKGNYGFDEFLSSGGASSDKEVVGGRKTDRLPGLSGLPGQALHEYERMLRFSNSCTAHVA